MIVWGERSRRLRLVKGRRTPHANPPWVLALTLAIWLAVLALLPWAFDQQSATEDKARDARIEAIR